MAYIRNLSIVLIFLSINYSCSIQKTINYFEKETKPTEDFIKQNDHFALDYSNIKNWAFRSDVHDVSMLLPNKYPKKNDISYDIDVFYVHPTTLFQSTIWNADTSYFNNNKIIEKCLENQASVFAGITNIYAPHYREMHIHSYTDTVNGYKAFDIAYNDVLNAFKYFIKHINKGKFIIASHSQGTNHTIRLIQDYISKDTSLMNNLILSYLIGMNVHENELDIPLCAKKTDLNCFLTWRSFNENYYPKKWIYGKDILSVNPISFTIDNSWNAKKDHKGILLPNKNIYFKKSVSVSNHLGILWVKFPNNIFLKKYKNNSYHQADYNLYWVNIRENLQLRLSKIKDTIN